MAEEKQKSEQEEIKETEKAVETKEEKAENKTEKKDEKKEKSKKKVEVPKKDEAVARGQGVHMSMKQGTYICRFIKGKKIDSAIKDLEEVVKLKKAVPFKGEIPHRKGKGMMSGRYPVKASGFVIKVLKGLKGNVLVNGMDLDKTVITHASSSWASRPARRGGMQAKRTNLIIKAREEAKK